MVPGETQRILNHTKQYACTEVFRLEELQKLAQEFEDEDEDENDKGNRWDLQTMNRKLTKMINDAAQQIKEFIKNLEEQDREK